MIILAIILIILGLFKILMLFTLDVRLGVGQITKSPTFDDSLTKGFVMFLLFDGIVSLFCGLHLIHTL